MYNKIQFVFLLIISGILFYYHQTQIHIAYVDEIKVFKDFKMSRDIDHEISNTIQLKAKEIDSLYLIVNDKTVNLNKEELLQEIVQKRNDLDLYSKIFAEGESSKIWKRLSIYADEFAEQEGYDIVLGSGPQKNILYGKNSLNVTSKFINFINKRYEGTK